MPAHPRLNGHTHLTVRPWRDVTIDAVGHDPRSYYAERFWLPILGPSVLWLLRRAAHTFDLHPEGALFDLEETARDLGLSYRGGSTSAFGRAVVRCVQFRMGRVLDESTIELRRHLPHLTRRQLERLTEAARTEHDALMDARRNALGGSGDAVVRDGEPRPVLPPPGPPSRPFVPPLRPAAGPALARAGTSGPVVPPPRPIPPPPI